MHVAGGGAMPSLAGIAVPFVLALTVGAQLAGAALSRWRLAVAVAVSQAAFHLLFTWGVGASVSIAAGAGKHAAHDPLALSLAVGGDGHASHSHFTASMIAAHTLAAIGTYTVLRHAEVLLEASRRWAYDLVSRLTLPTTRKLTPVGRILADRPTPARHTHVAAHAQGVRGPPLSLA